MNDSGQRRKRRPTLVEGFNNVPNILEEARRAVDDVTQATQNRGGGGATAATPEGRKGGEVGPKKRKAAPRKKPATESGRQKKPSRPPAPKEQPAVPPAAPALDIFDRPQLGLADFGIKVKHAIPGRIRLGLYKMLHNETLAEELPALLAAVPGIISVEASTATGSLLITFSPEEIAALKTRKNLAGVMHRFFSGLDTESLVGRMLGE